MRITTVTGLVVAAVAMAVGLGGAAHAGEPDEVLIITTTEDAATAAPWDCPQATSPEVL
ncbi:hypothetical protein AB0F81_09515 [Actinoplanes sp. NPDC024001]|uniref:hypothetical protein n=1 Tax=Actinoplanes sp. NPDC024001 TaxID=3154598 RepID=UPI003405F649